MSNENDHPSRPKLTSGPSLPIEGPQPKQPFNAGAFPGRDAPDAGQPADPNPFAQVYRSPFGGDQTADPRSSFAPTISLPTGGGAMRSIGEKFSPNP
ncbi:hypothetical protein, partial [Enhygromyxa salina]|uniref:hypothetical protein n=1 Tax=Enhygromyxa salina TaxID=215803 RepID=UPI0011B25D29